MKNEILKRTACYLSPQHIEEATQCADRLIGQLPAGKLLSDCKLLLAYGGGKDSSYMTAFVRLVQLMIKERFGETVNLRIVTNRHAAMSRAVMDNIDRTYKALGFYGDPQVEMFLIDGMLVREFSPDLPLPEEVRARNREDILISGHRFAGDGRSTFCNACNFSMVNSFGVGANYSGGIDVIITGDSKYERSMYAAWVSRLSKKFGLRETKNKTFKGFLSSMNDISTSYYTRLMGSGADRESIVARRITNEISNEPLFFSIFEDTNYAADAHWELLVNFLGFQFDDVMFSFSESDCGNPTIMAHLRALKSQYVHNRSYDEGLLEYVGFGIELMEKKEFPTILIEIMKARFDSLEKRRDFRDKANAYAFDTYGLTEDQLICLVYSPFTDNGYHLNEWINQQHPEMSKHLRDIHRGLGQTIIVDNKDILRKLEAYSGMSLIRMKALYGTNKVPSLTDPRSSGEVLSLVLAGDPHKKVIKTLKGRDGHVVEETISGR